MSWPALFRCKHPAAALAVEDRPTVTPHDADFERITIRMLCLSCGQSVSFTCMSCIGGVDAFLARKSAP